MSQFVDESRALLSPSERARELARLGLDPDGNGVSGDGLMGVVVHGAVEGVARPNTTVVTWIGSVEPENATENDIWEDTSV